LDGPGGNDGGRGNGGNGLSDGCPLVAEVFLGSHGIGPFRYYKWLCIYDCNTSCPASIDKIKLIVQRVWNDFDRGCSATLARGTRGLGD
jgi:hypothetical protein